MLAAALSGACRGDGEPLPPPAYPPGYAGTTPNFDDPAWAARRSQITAVMPEVELEARNAFTNNQLPSLVAGFLVDGRLVWWQGFGERSLEGGGAVTPHTVYRIASITKVVTAMAVLRLRDEGKLPLDTPAVTHLPELATMTYPTTDSPQITVRHLLTHTSGLSRLGDFDYASPRTHAVSEREILEALRGAPLENVPGVATVYSNLGYGLLGIIAGRAAGMPFHEYVDQKILAPLQMQATVWRDEEVPHDRLATGYAFEGGQYQARHHWKLGAAEGAGGLYSSLDDMVRLVAFHMTAWPPGARESREPLHNATLRESHLLGGFQRPGKGVALGGFWVERHQLGPTVVSHEGQTHQYAAVATFAPEERIGFIALTNTGKGSAVSPLALRVMSLVLKRIGGRAPGGRKVIVR